jgi:TRAP-type mannitol/chloroaromatic compound transport system permease small subunit
MLRAIEAGIRAWGRLISLSTLVLLCLCMAVVILRYGFSLGAVNLQEGMLYANALLFLGGAGYCLQRDQHVRVDVLYNRFSPRQQAWANLLGGLLLLLPFVVFVAWVSTGFISLSWRIREVSPEAGGLPWVYLLKSLIWLFCLNLFMQLLAMLIRQWHILRTSDDPEH